MISKETGCEIIPGSENNHAVKVEVVVECDYDKQTSAGLYLSSEQMYLIAHVNI